MDFLMKLDNTGVYDIVTKDGIAQQDYSIGTSMLNMATIDKKLPLESNNDSNFLLRGNNTTEVLNFTNFIYGTYIWSEIANMTDKNIALGFVEGEISNALQILVTNNIVNELKVAASYQDSNIIAKVTYKVGTENQELILSIKRR